MAVTWIGNTSTSKLHDLYDSAMNKIDTILNQAQEDSCDNTVIDNINAMASTIDPNVNNALNTVSSMTQKITNVMNCVGAVSPDAKNSTAANMSKTMNDILGGKPLENAITQLNSILDSLSNKTCDEIDSSVNSLASDITDLINKIADANSSISVTADLESKMTQTLAKAAGLINCLSDALKNDQNGMASSLEMVDSSLNGIATNIQASLTAGVNTQELTTNVKATISSNLDIKGAYDSLNDKITNLF